MFRVIICQFVLLLSLNCFAVENEFNYPDWFKISVLDLRDDLSDVKEANKKYLIMFMSQQSCGFCRIHLQKNWGDPELIALTQKHFEVLALDVRGSRKIIDFYGKHQTEKEYAHEHGFQFTPTLVFVDIDGHEVFRMPGLRSKKRFKAALNYVVGGHYKKVKFRQFLSD